MPRPSLFFLLVLLLSACDKVPPLRLPQVEQATEATQDSGERFRVHRDCSSTSKTVDDMIACMSAAGWNFATRQPGYPESCWQARVRGELDRIPPLCFVRAAERPTGGTSS